MPLPDLRPYDAQCSMLTAVVNQSSTSVCPCCQHCYLWSVFLLFCGTHPGAPLTYFNDGGRGGEGGPSDFLGLTFWPKLIFLGL